MVVLLQKSNTCLIEINRLGYHTAMIGKWHLKNEPAAFDFYTVLPGQGDYFNPTFRVRGDQPWPENTIQRSGHSSDNIGDIGLEWLDNDWRREEPFFLMLQFKAPHDFFEFAPRYGNYLENTIIPEPSSLYYSGNHGSIATRGYDDALIHDIGSSVGHPQYHTQHGHAHGHRPKVYLTPLTNILRIRNI